MNDALPSFRTPVEQAAYAAVLADLAGRDRGDEAVMIFREPTDPDAAVVADAIIRAGNVSDALYARLLAAADRLYAPPPVTRAVAFDAFGTLVHIGRKWHPFERLIRQARDRAEALPSPMVQPIGLADYAAALGLPHPDDELAMLGEELATIALYPDTLDALRRVREQGVRIAVASNLALPYAAPLKALLGDLVDIWHFSFDAGAIKPDKAFYAGLTTKLGCEASELLMVGDTWRDDIVGAVEARSRARWVNREGHASHARRFIAVRELGDAYPDRQRAAQMTELELVRSSINANLEHLHAQQWAVRVGLLRGRYIERTQIYVKRRQARSGDANHLFVVHQCRRSRSTPFAMGLSGRVRRSQPSQKGWYSGNYAAGGLSRVSSLPSVFPQAPARL
ncbi:HAD family hydrolase [Sphingomonas echinoides]|uniref:HAD family hydrolase n=1 Tax=Sphingomonas echinoides TaxID=59803 RepID=UPI002413A68E|nr:HAD family hydrolase [Sphingomonas echinoides]